MRIYAYATVSTDQGVLVIGGRDHGPEHETTIVAEFRDGNWNNIGNLARKRAYHNAIKSGSEIMVIGGVERDATMWAHIWTILWLFL